MLRGFFTFDDPVNESIEDEINFKLDFAIYEFFCKFSYSENTVNTLLEKNKLDLMDLEWIDLYTKSYKQNYKTKKK